jgi:hypothetical protein
MDTEWQDATIQERPTGIVGLFQLNKKPTARWKINQYVIELKPYNHSLNMVFLVLEIQFSCD